MQKIHFQSIPLTSKKNSLMVLEAGPYHGPFDHLSIGVFSHCQAIVKLFLKKKKDCQKGILLYTCTDNICPFQVKARKQSNNVNNNSKNNNMLEYTVKGLS